MVNVKESLEIVYTLTKEDAESAYNEGMSVLTKHSKVTQSNRTKIARIVLYLWFILGFTLIFIGERLPLLAAMAAATAVSFAMVYGMYKIGYANQKRAGIAKFIEMVAPNGASPTEHMVVINADGLFKHSKNMMVTFFWHYVREVAMTDKNIIFIMDPNQAPNAVLIPRRAFATDADAQDFYRAASQLRAAGALIEG